ncbi:SMP-30/gluconolactonase/LRE family protein [Variovorax sp. CAN2819]|uniref:SMP-30/gluconolactonase/LRE family protein n=1 Tax=Variovorax sp. CAN15 TaxID=3046727 RepID=UPI0026471624|nr:SMP-30/gluconolactonase/LRE family protein [Variovorax sp. CAN15]MDN6885230.1 SMP-30/gluconolactonase/LRE family protein [Variovorax sp. CAN15]
MNSTRTVSRAWRAPVALLLTNLLLAACGGGGGSGGGFPGFAVAPAPAPASQGTPPPAPAPEETAPVITTQPSDTTIGQGVAATLKVQAVRATAYQWQRSVDGGASWSDVSGATGDSFTTPASQLADNGQKLRVLVSGADGSVTSQAATLTVKSWVASVMATTGVTYSSPYQILLDSSGANLYVAMGGNGSVYRIDTASGNGVEVTPGVSMNAPFGLAMAADGTLYVSERHRINKIAPGATTFTTWVGSDSSGYADSPSAALFNNPASIALDGAGNLFVADLENKRVRKVAADGTTTTLAGDGTQAFLDGVGTAAQFARPQGLAISRDGRTLYDTDTDSLCLRKIDVATAEVSTLLGDCTSASPGLADGTAATPAKLGYTYGVTVDANNNVFLTHAWDGVARVVSPSGEISTLRDGTGAALTFNFPIGVAVAGDGTVYVGASHGNQIFKLTLAP